MAIADDGQQPQHAGEHELTPSLGACGLEERPLGLLEAAFTPQPEGVDMFGSKQPRQLARVLPEGGILLGVCRRRHEQQCEQACQLHPTH
ncbi:MAG: hypothetical protein AAGE01_17855 [Pseudomonadota bacterium]